MRRQRLAAKADAASHHDRADQTGDASVDVHHRAAGEIERALAGKPANGGVDLIDLRLRSSLRRFVFGGGELRGRIDQRVGIGDAPHPMRNREIDDRHPEQHEEHDRRKLHALGECADDQRRRDHRKGHLKDHVNIFRDHMTGREGRRERGERHAFQK